MEKKIVSDILMCNGGTCAYKDYCYRNTATPSSWQSYASSGSLRKDNGTCDFWMANDYAEKNEIFPIWLAKPVTEKETTHVPHTTEEDLCMPL